MHALLGISTTARTEPNAQAFTGRRRGGRRGLQENGNGWRMEGCRKLIGKVKRGRWVWRHTFEFFALRHVHV